jgi:hypothetical protein
MPARITGKRKGVNDVKNLDDKRFYRLGVAAVIALWLLVLVQVPGAVMNVLWMVGWFGGVPGAVPGD